MQAKLEEGQLPIQRSLLSDELAEKMERLKEKGTFEERESILRWAIEEMRTEVISHLHDTL